MTVNELKLNGHIFDGRWKIDHYDKTIIVLKNIYNDMEVRVSQQQIRDIISGKSSVSKIVTKRIPPSKNIDNRIWIKNGVVRSWGRQKYKYVMADLNKK